MMQYTTQERICFWREKKLNVYVFGNTILVILHKKFVFILSTIRL